MRAVLALSLLPLLVANAASTGGKAGGIDAVLRTSDARFVTLDEIVTPIFGESRIEGTLTARLVVETADYKVAAALRPGLPRIRAAALTTTLEFARLNASGYAPVDAPSLGMVLNRAVRAADPRVRRVLIVRLGAETD